MKLLHFHAPEGNFGDDLNLWLWDSVIPGWREALPDHLLVGVGTLLNGHLPRGVPKVVVGSGVGYGDLPDAELMSECRFVAVRGPRSAAALGLAPEKGIVDPAMLIPDLPEFQGIAKSGPPLFMPHYGTVRWHDWETICNKAGIGYISPRGESKEVIRKLAAAPLIITESMHGAILADAFGTPWRAVSITARFNDWKWADWAESLSAPLKIEPMFPLLDALSRIKPRGLAAKPAAGGGGAGGHGGDTQHIPRSRLQKMRRKVEPFMAVSVLRRLAAEQGGLSPRSRLEDAKSRYRAALGFFMEEVRG